MRTFAKTANILVAPKSAGLTALTPSRRNFCEFFYWRENWLSVPLLVLCAD